MRIKPGSVLSRLPQLGKDFLLSIGCDLRLDTDDRRILEDFIFPYVLSREDCRRILFVGCDWYTAGYAKVFRGREYWTIEIDARRRKYGAPQHVVGEAENVRQHFKER